MVSIATADVAGWRVNDESLLVWCDDGQSASAPAADEGLFCQLPNEIIRHVYTFFDIASLGSMAQINKRQSSSDDTIDSTNTTSTPSPSLSSMAMDDDTWSDLVHRRFQINTLKTRSKSFGGANWKDAYRSLSQCNRAPKCRFTSSRKVIFAKSSNRNNNTKFQSTNSLSVWVLLNHTENCETRRTAAAAAFVDYPFLSNIMRSNSTSTTPSTFESRNERRYIEFNVCLQNVKSSAGPITVDLLSTTLQVAAGMGSYQAVLVKGMPRMIHHHRQQHHHHHAISDNIMLMDEDTHDDGLMVLQPFDFCVVTMSFACGYDVFETDLLARALTLRVAIVDNNDDDDNMMSDQQHQEQQYQRQVSASFVPESDIWQCYMELPGGFLTLSDKTQLISV
jgi:hypothetical protein